MGRRAKMYGDREDYRRYLSKRQEGKLTTGYGLNPSGELSEDDAAVLLEHRLNKLDELLAKNLSFYPQLSAVRQDILCDMACNMGMGGLMMFKKMLAALENGDYDQAAEEMLDSRWAVQVKSRADNLAELMRIERSGLSVD